MIPLSHLTNTTGSLMRLVAAVAVGACVVVTHSGCSPQADAERPPQPELVVGEQGSARGQFQFPRAVAVDSKTGRFWVVDRLGRIQLFDADGEVRALWEIPKTKYGAPVGLHYEPGPEGQEGTLLVMDSHYQAVRRYSPDGKQHFSAFGTKGKEAGQFTFGRDVVADSKGFIYTGDYGGNNDRVQKFTRAGEFVLAWGKHGSGDGEFIKMQGMTIEPGRDGSGGKQELLLVCDQCNHRVQRFDLEGNFISAFGEQGADEGFLDFPSGVAVGSDGSIYVSEWGNNRVQRFDPNGTSTGSWGLPGARHGELKTPWDVEIGADDKLYVVDYGNHRLQIFRFEDDAAVTASIYRQELNHE